MIYEITGETYRTESDIEFCFKKNEEIHFFLAIVLRVIISFK